MTNETCEQCGFDSTRYTREDLRGTMRSFGPRWRWMLEGIDAGVLSRRPAPLVWSALEYANHTREVLDLVGLGVAIMLEENEPTFDPVAPSDARADDARPELDASEVVSDLSGIAERFSRLIAGIRGESWERGAIIGGERADVHWLIAHAVHDAEHHLQDVGRGLHALGAGAAAASGTVAQVNASGGGVPKLAMTGTARIGWRGLEGDRQRQRRHHGRPSQALCLWSTELIDGLAAEGHPIGPGCAGENLTISGLDWRAIRPGVRVGVGTALAEISGYADPCVHNARWFVNGDFRRIEHDLHPGVSRAYATVLEPGTVTAGDPVIVEPEACVPK